MAGHTKKVTTNAIFFVRLRGQLDRAAMLHQEPGARLRRRQEIAIAVCASFSLVVLVLIYASYVYENKKRGTSSTGSSVYADLFADLD